MRDLVPALREADLQLISLWKAQDVDSLYDLRDGLCLLHERAVQRIKDIQEIRETQRERDKLTVKLGRMQTMYDAQDRRDEDEE